MRVGAFAAGSFALAGHDHRQLYVLERRDAGNQIVKLEDEPDLAQAVDLERAFVHRSDVLPVDLDDAAGRTIDAAEQIEQRRFSAAARSHDRDRLSLLDAPVDAAQRMHFFRRHLVHLADAAHGHIHASWC